MPRAIALFSGGLDSMLAVRILQQQGFDVHALNVRTIYSCCRSDAAQAASALGIPLTVAAVGDDYLDVIRKPAFGYGKGANPCVDCRIYMCRMAHRFMQQCDACLVITGEVLGQRPMSQKRKHLEIIAHHSGLEGRLLRPLSAQLLPPTDVEREGLVDRSMLCRFQGRGRRAMIRLAEQLGIGSAPSPSTGCALTEPAFAARVFDLMDAQPDAARWDFELLSVGRHFRFDQRTKVVVGRNAEENARLRAMAARDDAPEVARMYPDGFRGPEALLVGPYGEAAAAFGRELLLRYAGTGQAGRIVVDRPAQAPSAARPGEP